MSHPPNWQPDQPQQQIHPAQQAALQQAWSDGYGRGRTEGRKSAHPWLWAIGGALAGSFIIPFLGGLLFGIG